MTPLIRAEDLLTLLQTSAPVVLVDCRFSLVDPGQGERDYVAGHIPGAVYAHLERHLSGVAVSGKTGRHPLPEVDSFARQLGAWGIDRDTRIVAYDAETGAFASRLWWLLRYLAHDAVQVLDGGLAAYLKVGAPLSTAVVEPELKTFIPAPQEQMLATLEEVELRSRNEVPHIFDARSADRFRGENETIDPRPGHIPGAKSLPFMENLADGVFSSPTKLRARFEEALAGRNADEAIFYCGSGVTACHNLLAAEVVGIHGIRLFAGSYSEWIANGKRPVETKST